MRVSFENSSRQRRLTAFDTNQIFTRHSALTRGFEDPTADRKRRAPPKGHVRDIGRTAFCSYGTREQLALNSGDAPAKNFAGNVRRTARHLVMARSTT